MAQQEGHFFGILSTPLSWARANLRFVCGIDVAYGSAQEGAAILTWQKNRRVELLRTIALVTGSANPERAQKALNMLIEEMFPEQKLKREEAIDKALEIMESEQQRVYNVKKTQAQKPAIGRKIADRLRRKPRGSH